MGEPEAAVAAVGFMLGAYAVWRGFSIVRKVVHLFDRLMVLVDKIETAVDIVVTELSPNGGSSFKDRTNQMSDSIRELVVSVKSLDASAEQRTERITAAVRKESS